MLLKTGLNLLLMKTLCTERISRGCGLPLCNLTNTGTISSYITQKNVNRVRAVYDLLRGSHEDFGFNLNEGLNKSSWKLQGKNQHRTYVSVSREVAKPV